MCVSVTVSVPCRVCIRAPPANGLRCGSLRHAKETIFGPVNYAVRATDGVFPFLLHVLRRDGSLALITVDKYETGGGPTPYRHRVSTEDTSCKGTKEVRNESATSNVCTARVKSEYESKAGADA